MGCPSSRDAAPPAEQMPLAGVKLKLLIVGDDALAQAIGRLRGEWQAQTGAELEVAKLPESELASADKQQADALVYPAFCLGPLAERGVLAPISQSSLTDPLVAWDDIFERDRSSEVTWGNTVNAVPLGSPVLVCFYRADLLARLGQEPPSTWAEYRQLAELLADRARLGDAAPPPDVDWRGAIEPLAPGWAGLTLLARAASYARHPNHYSTLFNMNSMEPLVAAAPFVRALSELAAAQRAALPQAEKCGPIETGRALLDGRCGLALGWSTAAVAGEGRTTRAQGVKFGCCPLPGAGEVYNPSTAAWEARPDGANRAVALMGLAGRIGSVSAHSTNPDAARQLLFWLASPRWSEHVSPASTATTLFRPSQIQSAGQWTDPALEPSEARGYALAVQSGATGAQYLYAPRIPGRERYLAALDEAVRRAVSGETEPQEALDAAAHKWREITADLGVEPQRRAYRRCLGVEP